MPPADADPIAAELDRAAAELARRLASRLRGASRRAAVTIGGVAVELRVGPAARRGRKGAVAALDEDILAAVGAAGVRLDRKEVFRALKTAGKRYGRSTVDKALGRLTAAGLLWNDRSGKGYGLPGWDRQRPTDPPRLFPDPEEWDRQVSDGAVSDG